MRAGVDRAARDARRAAEDGRGLGRARPPRSGLRVRPFVHRLRPDGGHDGPPRRAHPKARLRPGVGTLQGRGGLGAPRPQPHARRGRGRVREPRRHRPPDGRRLGLDRHARDGRAVPERLGAGRGVRGDRAGRLARHDRRLRARPPSRRAGCRSARSGSSIRSRSARFRRTRSTASIRRSRWARCSRASTSSTPAPTTSSSTSSPARRWRSAASRARTDEPPAPKPGWLVYAQEVMLENWVGQAFRGGGADARRRWRRRVAKLASKALGRTTKVDESYKVFASERHIKFTEMEYAVPRERGRELIEGVLEIAARPELHVAWPIEVRFVKGDDSFLSPSHDQDTCYVAVHQDRQARLGALLPPRRVARPRARRPPALGQAPLPRQRRTWPPRTRSGRTSKPPASAWTQRRLHQRLHGPSPRPRRGLAAVPRRGTPTRPRSETSRDTPFSGVCWTFVYRGTSKSRRWGSS